MELANLWHFARPELVKAYLSMLDTGLVTTATIFAPRRTGKTWFLLRDLKPAAEAAGYRVVYADLWQTHQSPGTALTRALETALQPQGILEKMVARLKTPVTSIKGKAGIAGTTVEGEVVLDVDKSPPDDVALHLDALIDALTDKAPLLLLVDEAQTLARNSAGEDMARALRTSMTTHPERLRVVFTGSSRTRLGHVFANANAPLFSAGTGIQDFPLLDDAFVEFIAGRFKISTRRDLDVALAKRAFADFGRRPEPLIRAVLSVVLDPARTLAAAVEQVHGELSREENHDGIWLALDAMEKALVRMIAIDVGLKPFSKAELSRLSAALGLDGIKPAQVQKVLTRLSAKAIVNKTPRGVFEFENENFAQWVRNLAH